VTNFVSRWQFTIEWGHCDPAGIVFNGRFFEFFDWGTWTLFATALGIKPPDLAALSESWVYRWSTAARAFSRRHGSATRSS
jgi:acyl-CoA thioesterase FadM